MGKQDPLVISGKQFSSRLILGTGKYRSMEDMVSAVEASGTEIITVALRRLDLDDPNKKTILDYIDWSRYHILPNTAGCRTPEEALTIARLARAMGLSEWIKLEVIPDAKYLLPDPIGTLEAAKMTSQIVAPVSGTVVRHNDAVLRAPLLVKGVSLIGRHLEVGPQQIHRLEPQVMQEPKRHHHHRALALDAQGILGRAVVAPAYGVLVEETPVIEMLAATIEQD